MAEAAAQAGLGGPFMAEAIWRCGLERDAAFHLGLGMRCRRRADGLQYGSQHGWTDADGSWHRRAESSLPAAHSRRHGLVVSGLFGAGFRLGPRLAAMPRGFRW